MFGLNLDCESEPYLWRHESMLGVSLRGRAAEICLPQAPSASGEGHMPTGERCIEKDLLLVFHQLAGGLLGDAHQYSEGDCFTGCLSGRAIDGQRSDERSICMAASSSTQRLRSVPG